MIIIVLVVMFLTLWSLPGIESQKSVGEALNILKATPLNTLWHHLIASTLFLALFFLVCLVFFAVVLVVGASIFYLYINIRERYR